MLAREKPHCGNSGVPFMKRTTGDVETALSMAARVESERLRRMGWWSGNAKVGLKDARLRDGVHRPDRDIDLANSDIFGA